MAFCNSCIRPADSSVLTYAKHSSISFKTFFRRQILKKSSTIHRQIQKQGSNQRFQRIKGSNIIREVNPQCENDKTIELTNNYDMTVFHDDEIDDTQIALSRRRSKKIPSWAKKNQLQLAIINQIYYNDKNPEDIFGSIHLEHVHEMVNSIELWNTEVPLIYSYSNLPSNFV